MIPTRWVSLSHVAAVFLLVCVASGSLVHAQIPDTFENLKVLPKDITKGELVGRMREFAGALGVRCNHCHVGENVMTLEGFDWSSDAKETKQVARGMIKMIAEINGKLLPGTGRSEAGPIGCITCHRGLEVPRTLKAVLREVVEAEGVDAAIERYKELREEYHGRGAYDFGLPTLSATAEWLARQKKDVAGALTIQKLNAELNPDNPNVYFLLGQLYAASGDKNLAVATFEHLLELQPDNVWAKKAIEKLNAETEGD